MKTCYRVHHCIVVTEIGHAGFYLPVISAVNSSLADIQSFADSNKCVTHKVSLVHNGWSDKFTFLFKNLNAHNLKYVLDLRYSDSCEMCLRDIFEELSKNLAEDDLVLVTFISELRHRAWNDKTIYFNCGLTTDSIKPIITHYSSKGWSF